ncbi:hypothetical protein CEP51_003472 [Fusarium floridanum]|uniref:EKC/KEOPS complex subunit BUD32 n=1 Tax=Fusarium floridanum TaxID=1325733 RepID=A0A428S5V9_9HYPO|nr:hypothetical protein CEP51_003472 [Fusarium floridanum]
MSSVEDDDESYRSFRFLLPNVGDTEEVERYESGGFHPVHLGDLFDEGRYRVVHKLGAGGFATIWLARDLLESSWVALKIVLAEESQSVEASATLAHNIVSESFHDSRFVTYERYFHIEGPNGRHLCLVLPVLGPSAYRVSHYLESRIQPRLARNVALQAAEALADLHSRGLCHGDLTPANIMFRIKDFDHVSEDEIYDLLGRPETGPLETESGEPAGPEAPGYIVKTLDFLKARRPIISEAICLIDFDNAFLASSPPEKLLPTPVEYLAPEVAAGLSGGKASDIWALGCSILRLRSGEGLFSAYDIGSPVDLLVAIHRFLGKMPTAWGNPVFDSEGRPRKTFSKGAQLSGLTDQVTEQQSIEGWIKKIFDQPGTGPYRPKDQVPNTEEHPFYNPHEVSHAPFYAWKFWEPSAINFRGKYFRGYNHEWHALVDELPKISNGEAGLLFDLISKILVYEPTERSAAREILDHPWFHIDDDIVLAYRYI